MRIVRVVSLVALVAAVFLAANSHGALAQRPTRQNWEYDIVFPGGGAVAGTLDEEGARGWELVAVANNGYIFKRPR